MSEIAGKLATQAGAFMLEKPFGGRGILLGGVPGVAAATVMIIGGGVVGMNAAFIAIGMEADVFVFDKSIDRLRGLDVALGGRASTVYSSTLSVEEMLPRADLVIGAVLVHGARAPRIVKREQLKLMKPGAVLVDVSIDQGGCFETSRPTTHSDPTYEVDGVLHYCVANMPGAVPITSTYALTNATLPYVLELAEHGIAEAVQRDPALRPGVNIAGGHVTHPAVADSLGLPLVPLDEALRLGLADCDLTLTTDSRRRHDGDRRTDRHRDPELHRRRAAGLRLTARSEPVLNPATGEQIATSPLSGEEDVDAAVQAAKRAFQGVVRDAAG